MVEYLLQLLVSVVVASPQNMKCLDQHQPKPDQRREGISTLLLRDTKLVMRVSSIQAQTNILEYKLHNSLGMCM